MDTVSEQSSLQERRDAISAAFLMAEAPVVELLLGVATLTEQQRERIRATTLELVFAVRRRRIDGAGIQNFLQEFNLSSREGVLLMCMAETLLRIPDTDTADRLVQDKLVQGEWARHSGNSDSFWINASTWALMLSGRLLGDDETVSGDAVTAFKRLLARSGEPLVRLALKQAMHILAAQFVMGRDIEQALARSREGRNAQYRYSFDMLGEAALTREDAQRHAEAYAHAIRALGNDAARERDLCAAPSISVKLSALHPRYEPRQRVRALRDLTSRLRALVVVAKAAGIALTIDAEESERLELSLEVFAPLFCDSEFADYHGLGLAVQAYQKRALPVIEWLATLARQQGKRVPLRLVKGAYWDTEIKHAQALGLAEYPVFTRKAATDVSYLACARRILAAGTAFHPQFATHNAQTVAAILEFAQDRRDFEFQRLHGMGVPLYEELLAHPDRKACRCRVYAPVGSHSELLPYLIRRLLENGANTSFVHELADVSVPATELTEDPVALLAALPVKSNPSLPAPRDLFGGERASAAGVSFADPIALAELQQRMRAPLADRHHTSAMVGTESCRGTVREIRAPADHRKVVGTVEEADENMLERALVTAARAAPAWDRTRADERARILESAADRIGTARPLLLALLVQEAGKTLPDALAEVREAEDYCRYYAVEARRGFAQTETLPGTTGELNQLTLRGRGVFAAISPWNFPLAILVGQITAALAAGNAVIAKPARQTPLIGGVAIRLLHEAGVPKDVLHYLPGPGATLGARLAADPRINGVVMTGATATAQAINRILAARAGAIVPLIAETGGLNAMIVDSTALPEQVVVDVLQSAFNSAGQRCSALRVLFLQEEIAPRVLGMLRGAMEELVVGDPGDLATDVGPVIDQTAKAVLERHIDELRRQGRPICALELPAAAEHGSFVAPCAFEIAEPGWLRHEVFGPVLHVIRYERAALDKVIAAINDTGYGLTLGVHSRIDARVHAIQRSARVGNLYVNRNMIGAVVGAQPFGGEGLSGTGPKAGGPHYLPRFATERVVSINTAAIGGNAALFDLGARSRQEAAS